MKEYAVVLEFLAKFLIQPPDKKTLETVIREQMMNNWPVPVEDETGQRGLTLFQQFLQGEPEKLQDSLRQDFFSLFEMSPPGCYIHESVWRGKDKLLYEKETFAVRSWYARYGLQAHNSDKGPDDHLGLELSFVAYLLNQPGNKQQQVELQKDAYRFIQEHIMQWGPRCLEKITEQAKTDFYQGLGLLTLSTLRQIEKLLTNKMP